MTSRFYDIDEIAALLKVSPRKVNRWIQSGELKATNVATKAHGTPRFRVSEEDLEIFTRRREVGVEEPSPMPRHKRLEGVIEFFK